MATTSDNVLRRQLSIIQRRYVYLQNKLKVFCEAHNIDVIQQLGVPLAEDYERLEQRSVHNDTMIPSIQDLSNRIAFLANRLTEVEQKYAKLVSS